MEIKALTESKCHLEKCNKWNINFRFGRKNGFQKWIQRKWKNSLKMFRTRTQISIIWVNNRRL